MDARVPAQVRDLDPDAAVKPSDATIAKVGLPRHHTPRYALTIAESDRSSPADAALTMLPFSRI